MVPILGTVPNSKAIGHFVQWPFFMLRAVVIAACIKPRSRRFLATCPVAFFCYCGIVQVKLYSDTFIGVGATLVVARL